jgi:pimeloyl-ACP methyl ester carboxylesterase
MLSSLPASAARDVTGDWSAKIQGMLRLVLHVQHGASGYTATLDSPDQGAMGLAIDAVHVAGDSLMFEMNALQANFAGRLSTTGDTLTGAWRQGGITLPVSFARGAIEAPRRTQEVWPPYPYDTLEVSVPNRRAPGVTLAGTLTEPKGKGPFPAVALITGSGPEDRDETIFGHRPFRVLADHLTRQGIAVLRLDDRGVGRSTGSFGGVTSEDFATDALASVEFLRARKEIGKIGLIGHSEGGLIAPMVANRTRDVAFVVLMAGPSIRGDSLLMLQSTLLRRQMGMSDEELTREREVSRKLYAAMKKGDSTAVAHATRELVDLQIGGAGASGAVSPDTIAAAAMRQIWSPWMRFFVAYDPAPALTRLKCPVLALNGSKDLQVPPKENLAGMRTALAGNQDATVRELPNLNHLFQTAETGAVTEYSSIEETMAPVALDTISKWIVARTGAKR